MRRQSRLWLLSSPEKEEGVPAFPFLMGSLTPSSQKRSKKQPTYQYHMVPRAGGSSHCQPRTPFGAARTSGLL